ncbi:hypothetical protein TWF281_002130 [Arthrobotrys megalospora]
MAEARAPQTPSSQASPNPKKRKYDRQPDTEAMTQLRLEAAKALKKKLGLSIDAAKVNFNSKPFPRKKTVYIWKTHGELTQDDRELLAQTIKAESVQRRFFWRWSDRDRIQLASMIKRGALVPEYYDRTGSLSGSQPAAWEPSPSDTDGDDDGDTEIEVEYHPPKKRYSTQLSKSTNERPTKRPRESSTEPANECSDDAPAQISDNIAPELLPTISSTLVQTETVVQISKKCSLQSARSPTRTVSPDTTGKQETPTPTTTTNPTPPRTMTLNANGILELVPIPMKIIPPCPQLPVAAPTAASPSPFTAMMEPLKSYVEQDNMDIDDDENDAGKKYATVAMADMRRCMEVFLDHATVGYFGIHRVRKEKNSLRKECAEKELQYEERLSLLSAKEHQLEEEMKLVRAKENMLKGRISSLEADNAKHVEDRAVLERKYQSLQDEKDREKDTLQKEKNTLQEEKDSMRDQIYVLEQDLATARTSEKHLRHNENAMKDSYQLLAAERDELKASTDLEVKELKQQIVTLHQSQSGLEGRLKALAETHESKETTLQETILALEARLNTVTAERDSLQRLQSKVSEDVSSFLQNFMKNIA